MPNYCDNKLLVTGPKDILDAFLEVSWVDGEFEFGGIVDPSKYEPDGYLSRKTVAWGTKWGAMESNLDDWTDTEFQVSFQTAWCPPINWAKNVLKDERFQDLKIVIAYCDLGSPFYGVFSCDKNGDKDYEYSVPDKEFRYDDEKDDYIIPKYTNFYRFVEKWGFDFGYEE